MCFSQAQDGHGGFYGKHQTSGVEIPLCIITCDLALSACLELSDVTDRKFISYKTPFQQSFTTTFSQTFLLHSFQMIHTLKKKADYILDSKFYLVLMQSCPFLVVILLKDVISGMLK